MRDAAQSRHDSPRYRRGRTTPLVRTSRSRGKSSRALICAGVRCHVSDVPARGMRRPAPPRAPRARGARRRGAGVAVVEKAVEVRSLGRGTGIAHARNDLFQARNDLWPARSLSKHARNDFSRARNDSNGAKRFFPSAKRFPTSANRFFTTPKRVRARADRLQPTEERPGCRAARDCGGQERGRPPLARGGGCGPPWGRESPP